jgi:mitogen-activated protein kinase kinase
MEKHNRKSHLAPQLSPGTQALLRGDDDSPKDGKTPTSGDIPIADDMRHQAYPVNDTNPLAFARRPGLSPRTTSNSSMGDHLPRAPAPSGPLPPPPGTARKYDEDQVNQQFRGMSLR